MPQGESRTAEMRGRATMQATGPAAAFGDPSWPVDVQGGWVSIPGSPWSTGSDAFLAIRRVSIVRTFWLPKEELPAGDYLLSYPRLWIRGILRGFNDYNAYSSVKAYVELEQTLIPPTVRRSHPPFTNPTNEVPLLDIDRGKTKTRYHTLPWRNGRAAETFDFSQYLWSYDAVPINRSQDLAIALRVSFWTEIIGWGDIQLGSYRYRWMGVQGPEIPYGLRLPKFEVVGIS